MRTRTNTRKIFMVMFTLACACIMMLGNKQNVKAACAHPYTASELLNAATCTEPAKKKSFCVSCRETLKEYTEGTPLGHNSKWVTTTEPTCCTGGEEKYKCERCGHVSDGHKLNASGNHSWVETESTNATCSSAGTKSYKCSTSGCTATKKENNGDKLGHDYKWETTVEPTCGTGGEEKYKCKRCGHVSDGHKLDATGKHSWKLTSKEKPTCTTAEKLHYTCTVCKKTKIEKGEAKLGHKYEIKVTQKPTCEKEGKKEKICKVCKYAVAGDNIEPLGHNWKKATCSEAKHCTREGCGKKEGKKLGHNWSEATVTAPATCSRCKEEKGKTLAITVKFNYNSFPATNVVTSLKEHYNENYSLPETPEAADSTYVFQGWYTEKDGGIEVTTSTKVSCTESHTLYAHWKKKLDSRFKEVDSINYFPYLQKNYDELFVNIQEDRDGNKVKGFEGLYNSNRSIMSETKAKNIFSRYFAQAEALRLTLAGKCLYDFNPTLSNREKLTFGNHKETADVVRRSADELIKASYYTTDSLKSDFNEIVTAAVYALDGSGSITIANSPEHGGAGIEYDNYVADPLLFYAIHAADTTSAVSVNLINNTYIVNYKWYVYDYYNFDDYNIPIPVMTVSPNELGKLNTYGDIYAKNYVNLWTIQRSIKVEKTDNKLKDVQNIYTLFKKSIEDIM